MEGQKILESLIAEQGLHAVLREIVSICEDQAGMDGTPRDEWWEGAAEAVYQATDQIPQHTSFKKGFIPLRRLLPCDSCGEKVSTLVRTRNPHGRNLCARCWSGPARYPCIACGQPFPKERLISTDHDEPICLSCEGKRREQG